MNVFEILEKQAENINNISVLPTPDGYHLGSWPGVLAIEPPELTEEPTPELTSPSPPQLRPWSEVPLIEMVPLQYRAEVAAILERNPNAYQILEQCKAGVMDCWQAMGKLGVPDFQHQEHDADPEPNPETTCLYCVIFGTCEEVVDLAGSCERFEPLVSRGDGETLAVPAEPLSFPCQGCESHHMGWCRSVPGKAFCNVAFITACPLGVDNDCH